ncbi:PLP-dependent transferase, partial [bacterium]|nr:PLP-dependent transferase [bacterium]
MCVRSVRCTKAAFGAIATPIFQSATFVHEGIDKESEYSYSRMQNPTRAALENRIAELEGGFDAIAFSSGMAAETALMNLFESSGHIISGDDLYGGTLRLFRHNAVSAGLRSVSPSNGLAGFFVFMNIFLSGGLSGPVSVFPEIL